MFCHHQCRDSQGGKGLCRDRDGLVPPRLEHHSLLWGCSSPWVKLVKLLLELMNHKFCALSPENSERSFERQRAQIFLVCGCLELPLCATPSQQLQVRRRGWIGAAASWDLSCLGGKKILYLPFLEQTKGPETYNSSCFFLLHLKWSLFITDSSFCYQISGVDKWVRMR